MTRRIEETKATLIDRLARDVELFRAVNPGGRHRVAQAAVNLVFELLGIEEVRAELYATDEAPAKYVERQIRDAVAHKVTEIAPTEVSRRPQTEVDKARRVYCYRASALVITKEVVQ